MSEMGGIEAGPLYVDVVADASGFGRDLQEKINAETARVKANITATIDTRKAEAQLAAVERKQRQVALGATVDTAKVEAQLDAVERKKRQVELGVTVDQAKADAQLAAIAAKTRKIAIDVEVNDQAGEAKLAAIEAKRRVVQIRADADTAAAEAKISMAADKTRVSKIKADADVAAAEEKLANVSRDRKTKIQVVLDKADNVGQSITGLGTGALGLMQMPAIAAGISMAVGAVAQLAAGLFSVAAAAAPALGLLAAIPGAVAGVAQGVGSVVVGFMGIGAAVKASAAAEAAASAQSGASSAQRAAAAQRIVAAQDRVKQSSVAVANAEANAQHSIEQAQQAVATAHQQGARAIISAEQQVIQAHQEGARQIATAQREVTSAIQTAARDTITAEKDVANAQRDAMQAQLDLVRAREQATRQLQDMNNNLTDQNFTVEQAGIDIQRADQNRTKVMSNPKSTNLDKEEADLQYREAIQRLQEEQLQQQRLQKDTAAANKAGVEGSSLVQQARQKVQDATQKLIDAEGHLRQVRVDGAQKVAQAEANLAQARQEAAQRDAQAEAALAQARQDAAQRNAQAEAALANTRRTSAFSVQSAQHEQVLAQRELASAQANAALQTTKTSTANAALATAMRNLSPAGRQFVAFLRGTLMPAWQDVQKATQQALIPPVQRGLQGLLPLLGVLQTGMVTTARILGGAFEDLSKHFLATPIFKRDLSAIMATNNRAFTILATALTPIVRALTDVTVAAGPLLLRFASFIAYGARMAAAFVDAQRASGGLSRFFQTAGDTAAQLWRIVRDLVVAVFDIGKAAYPAGRVLLSSFEGVVAKWREWTGSMTGQSTLRDYFMRSIPIVQALGRLIHDVVVDFFKLGNNDKFAGLIEQIRTVALPAIYRLGQTLNGAFGPALVTAITDVVNLISDLAGGGGGGALTNFVTTLDSMVKLLDRIARNPVGAWFLQIAASIAGTAAALALIGGPLIRVSGLLVKVGGFAKGFIDVAGGAEVAEKGITKLGGSVASKVIPAIKGIGTAAVAAGRLFLASGPWGWIILGVTAAVAAFIYAYTHFQTFHDIVNNVLHAVGAAAQWFWKSAIVPAFNGVVAAVKWVGGIFQWFWSNVVKPVFSAISAYIGWSINQWHLAFNAFVAVIQQIVWPLLQWFYNAAIKPIFNAIGAVISAWWTGVRAVFQAMIDFIRGPVWSALTWLWHHAISPVFDGIAAAASAWWRGMRLIFDALIGFLQRTLGPVFTWLRDRVITPVFNGIRDTISTIWNRGIKPIFDAIKTAVGRVADAFRTGVSAIGRFWDGLKSAVANPVKFVVDTIYNQGIRGFWNMVASKVGLPQLDKLTVKGINAATGGVVPVGPTTLGGRTQQAFATGGVSRAQGVLPGYAPGVDIVHAVLSPGEGILVPEAVRGLARNLGTSAEIAIQTINSAFSSRVRPPSGVPGLSRGGLVDNDPPRFGIGGVLGWVGNQIGKGASAAGSWVGDKIGAATDALKNAVAGMLSGPLHAAAGPIHSLINSVLPSSPWFTNLLRTGGNKIIDDAISNIVGKDQTMNAPLTGGGLGGGVGWQQLWSIIHGAFPAAKLFSSFRPNAITVSGNTSYHALGEAIDVTPSMAIFNWIAQHYPRTAELIFSPANGRQIKNGHPYLYSGAVRAEHFNHVHWALGNAGSPFGASGSGGPIPGGSGVARWRPMVTKALSALGLSTSAAMVAKVLRQINTESGGNPNAVQQIHDINSGGNEARGILQVIPSTFRAFHVPGTPFNILDPWANIMAALSYAKSRYGPSLSFLGQGHGYGLGGVIPAIARMATGGVTHLSAHARHLAHLARVRHLAHIGHPLIPTRPRTTTLPVHHAAHPAHPASLLSSTGDTGAALMRGVTAAGSHVAPVVRALVNRITTSGDTGAALLRALASGRLFDSGGILRPGTTLAHNATGENEYILTGPQWDSISTLAATAAERAVPHEPTAAERLAGAQININVHPQPGTDAREVAREVAVELGWLLR